MIVPSSCLAGVGTFMTRRRLNARMRTRLSTAGSTAITSSISRAVPEQARIVAEQKVVKKIGGLVAVRTIERGRWIVPFAPAKQLFDHWDLALVFLKLRPQRACASRS